MSNPITEQDVSDFIKAEAKRLLCRHNAKRVHLSFYKVVHSDGTSGHNVPVFASIDGTSFDASSLDALEKQIYHLSTLDYKLARAAELRREADRIEAEAKGTT